MSEDNTTNTIPFISLVNALEDAMGRVTGIMELISLISEPQYLELRTNIISAFHVSGIEEFTNEFGVDVEFGDISDAVRETTFMLYPQSTEMMKPISFDERKKWCTKIINNMDIAAAGNY